ncbi:hypothetical protein HUJ04_011005 [Dendroctonus ponderosae]|nr:hypothetical protein HUJ04_011005 [Dendroctonus ponderosae]
MVQRWQRVLPLCSQEFTPNAGLSFGWRHCRCKCEVSGEAPYFETVADQAHMLVVGNVNMYGFELPSIH